MIGLAGAVWVGLLAAALAVAWAVAFQGGEAGAQLWLGVVMGAGPVLGLATLMVSALRLAFIRRLRAAPLFGLLVGLLGGFPSLWLWGVGVVPYPGAQFDSESAITVAWPFDRPGVVEQGGLAYDQNHNVTLPATRFALEMTPDPSFSLTAKAACPQVLAPVSGEVVEVRGDLPTHKQPKVDEHTLSERRDELSFAAHGSWQSRLGNRVTIRTRQPDGVAYVTVAHLARNSTQVTAGETVTAGTPIGRCISPDVPVHLHAQRQSPLDVPFPLGTPIATMLDDGQQGPSLPTRGKRLAPLS